MPQWIKQWFSCFVSQCFPLSPPVAELESRFHPSKETAARGATGHLPGALSQFIRDVEKFGFSLTWKDLAKVSKT
jgi:hypothetical protein